VQEHARQQTGQQDVRIRVEDCGIASGYANAVRTNATAEEMMLDFGINSVVPASGPKAQPEMLFQVSQRGVMNLCSAKRIGITMGQVFRRNKEKFGEITLDVGKRQKSP